VGAELFPSEPPAVAPKRVKRAKPPTETPEEGAARWAAHARREDIERLARDLYIVRGQHGDRPDASKCFDDAEAFVAEVERRDSLTGGG